MADANVHERYLTLLVERIREDTYPSSTHMDLVESMLPRELLEPYLELLLEKVEQDRFPSVSMLRRIERLVAQAA